MYGALTCDAWQEFDKNGSKSTGSAVWEGAVVLTKYMEGELPADYWKVSFGPSHFKCSNEC